MDETGNRKGENANVWAADAYYRGDSDFINDKGEKSKWQKKKDYDEKDEGNKELKHMGRTVRLQKMGKQTVPLPLKRTKLKESEESLLAYVTDMILRSAVILQQYNCH